MKRAFCLSFFLSRSAHSASVMSVSCVWASACPPWVETNTSPQQQTGTNSRSARPLPVDVICPGLPCHLPAVVKLVQGLKPLVVRLEGEAILPLDVLRAQSSPSRKNSEKALDQHIICGICVVCRASPKRDESHDQLKTEEQSKVLHSSAAILSNTPLRCGV